MDNTFFHLKPLQLIVPIPVTRGHRQIGFIALRCTPPTVVRMEEPGKGLGIEITDFFRHIPTVPQLSGAMRRRIDHDSKPTYRPAGMCISFDVLDGLGRKMDDIESVVTAVQMPK